MNINFIAIPAIALAAGISLAACSGSPPAQDPTACRLAVSSLNKTTSADPMDYIVAAAIAKDPQLQSDLKGMGEGLSTLSMPGAIGDTGDSLANTSIRDAGRICTADGVSWPAGDS